MKWEARKSLFPDLYPVGRGWLVVETGDNESPLSSRLVAKYVSEKNAKFIAAAPEMQALLSDIRKDIFDYRETEASVDGRRGDADWFAAVRMNIDTVLEQLEQSK